MHDSSLLPPRRARGLAVALTTSCLWAAALPAGAAGDGPLSGERIRSLLEGNSLSGPYYGSLYDFSYAPGGAIYGDTGGGTDSGSWRIRDDDVYCHAWTTLFDGTERCYRWFAEDDGRYRLENVDAYRRYDLQVWRIRPGLDY